MCIGLLHIRLPRMWTSFTQLIPSWSHCKQIDIIFSSYTWRFIEEARLKKRSNRSDQQLQKERVTFSQAILLLLSYLDCPPGLGLHCPNASALALFKSAVEKGWICKSRSSRLFIFSLVSSFLPSSLLDSLACRSFQCRAWVLWSYHIGILYLSCTRPRYAFCQEN